MVQEDSGFPKKLLEATNNFPVQSCLIGNLRLEEYSCLYYGSAETSSQNVNLII
jgi:hypothetical protein